MKKIKRETEEIPNEKFGYSYSWSRETEVKTEPNRDRGGPRPDRD